MRTNDIMKLYVELFLRKINESCGDRTLPFVNSVQQDISSAPLVTSPSEVTTEWNWSNEVSKVYNQV